MRIAQPSAHYSARWLIELVKQVTAADGQNLKRGRDVELQEGRIIMTSPNGTRYALTIDDAGNLGATPA